MQHTIHCIIEGTVPLIQNVPHDAPGASPIGASDTSGIKKSSKRKARPELLEVYLYRSAKGELQHPSHAIKMLLRRAAKNFKKGRGHMAETIKELVFLEGEWMNFTNKTEPDSIIIRRPRTPIGQVTPFNAPMYKPGWRMEFWIVLADDEILSVDYLKEILDFGGHRIGIGSGRPDYGRFMVVLFEEAEVAQAA